MGGKRTSASSWKPGAICSWVAAGVVAAGAGDDDAAGRRPCCGGWCEGAQAAGTLARGRMADNLNLPERFVAGMEAAYRGTRQGREELDGELVGEAEGALWTRALLEACRVSQRLPGTGRWTQRGAGTEGAPSTPPGRLAVLRIVPLPVRGGAGADRHRRGSAGLGGGDACGIVACGVDAAASARAGRSQRARAFARGVGVGGGGGGRGLGRGLRDRRAEPGRGHGEVGAARGGPAPAGAGRVRARWQGRRAEPVAMLFEAGRAKLAGSFPALEDELCG